MIQPQTHLYKYYCTNWCGILSLLDLLSNYFCYNPWINGLVFLIRTSLSFPLWFLPSYNSAGMEWDIWRQFPSGNIIQGFGWGELYFKKLNVLETVFWYIVLQVVKLPECEIYSYNPDSDSDPFLEKGAM